MMYLVSTLFGYELGRKTINTMNSIETVKRLYPKANPTHEKNSENSGQKYIFLPFFILLFNLMFSWVGWPGAS